MHKELDVVKLRSQIDPACTGLQASRFPEVSQRGGVSGQRWFRRSHGLEAMCYLAGQHCRWRLRLIIDAFSRQPLYLA